MAVLGKTPESWSQEIPEGNGIPWGWGDFCQTSMKGLAGKPWGGFGDSKEPLGTSRLAAEASDVVRERSVRAREAFEIPIARDALRGG